MRSPSVAAARVYCKFGAKSFGFGGVLPHGMEETSLAIDGDGISRVRCYVSVCLRVFGGGGC